MILGISKIQDGSKGQTVTWPGISLKKEAPNTQMGTDGSVELYGLVSLL